MVTLTGLNGTPPSQLRPALRREALRAVYEAFRAEGLTAREMAGALGIKRSMVYSDLRAIGLSPGRNTTPKHLRKAIEISAETRKARTAARTEKHCPRCEQTLPLAEFHSNRGAADGLAGYCKDCMKSWRREHKAGNRDGSRPAAPADSGLAGCEPPRRCTRCGAEKPAEAFARRAMYQRRRAICKACTGARRREKQAAVQPAPRERPAAQRRRLSKAEAEAKSAAAVRAELGLIEQAGRLGVRSYRLRAQNVSQPVERWCCMDPGDGSHDASCVFAARAG